MISGRLKMTADLKALCGGSKAEIAHTLSGLEEEPGAHAPLLDAAAAEPKGHVLGLTGPPGVGKSSLTNALVKAFRGQGHRIAIVAVDPSSTVSRGALLGDRTRIRANPDDGDIFIR